MGKGRAPCCDKSKVKKGPWTPEEDMKLIYHIEQFGHPNWRALPAKAGLLRCGKSCRLRWINYLRPDVKRGNITLEEEETIINLHKEYGNKWSKIASHLPGRTDNEIKNVWNTHLKKRFGAKDDNTESKTSNKSKSKKIAGVSTSMSSSSSTTSTAVSPAKDEIEYSMSSNDESPKDLQRSISIVSNVSSSDRVIVEKPKEENVAESHDTLPFQTTPNDLDMEFWYTLEGMGSILSYDDNRNLNLWGRTW